MPGTNAEIVRRALAAWNARDQRVMDELFHPDFEYRGLAEWPGLARAYSGSENPLVRQTAVDAAFDDFRSEPVELIDAGDRVVCVLEMTAVGKGSGIPVRFIEATVVTIRDGQIVRIEVCDSRAAALDVAGASG